MSANEYRKDRVVLSTAAVGELNLRHEQRQIEGKGGARFVRQVPEVDLTSGRSAWFCGYFHARAGRVPARGKY